jgi:uncharacterized membrane protein
LAPRSSNWRAWLNSGLNRKFAWCIAETYRKSSEGWTSRPAGAIIVAMLGTIEGLALAVACFVGGHFALSSLPVRRQFIRIFGEGGFRGIYSLAALGALIWAIAAYREAPTAYLWDENHFLARVPGLLMLIACQLAVAGMTTRNVTMVGGESLAGEPGEISGIVTITRHPFLWAVTLWSAGHISANGDLASIIFFGGFALLSLGGMLHIDYRRRAAMGAEWGPVAMTTSAIPFLAAIQGRHPIDWRGIGWLRVGGGLALYLLLPVIHPWIGGVPILPEYLALVPQ